jgi:peptide-methionine (S)-S-oxide reductase
MRQRAILIASVVLAFAYVWLRGGFVDVLPATAAQSSGPAQTGSPPTSGVAKATLAAGCFWCVEADFDKLPGVISTTSGYTGGRLANPTYEQVSRGGTGHTEAVEIVYDPAKVTYEQLLDHFWKNVDPLTAHRQFCDVGEQYRPAIFVHDEAQRAAADASKKRVQQRFKDPVVVEIAPAAAFYRAEAYHQDYYKKNPVQYRYYRWSCGRDARLKELWRNASN